MPYWTMDNTGKSDLATTESIASVGGSGNGYIIAVNNTGSAVKWKFDTNADLSFYLLEAGEAFSTSAGKFVGTGDTGSVILPVGGSSLRAHNTGSGSHTVQVTAGALTSTHGTSAVNDRNIAIEEVDAAD